MKNFCPQCGEKLFTEKEMNHISMIQSRVIKQDFVSDLEEQEIYDLSLFVYNEIIGGYGRIIIDEELKKIINSARAKEEGLDTAISGAEESSEVDLKKLKAQIREEEAARVALESRQQEGSEDVDDRVTRLKKIHKSNPIKAKNPSVRRVES
jgi:hypothetical protein